MLKLQKWKSHLIGKSWFRPIHSWYTGYKARAGGHFNWEGFPNGLDKKKAANPAKLAPSSRILFATSIGLHFQSTIIEGLLGKALSLRGARSDYLLCDASLPACMICEMRWYHDLPRFCSNGPEDHCSHCYHPAANSLQHCGQNIFRYSEFLNQADRLAAEETAKAIPCEEISSYVLDEEIPIGEHALAGALRFFSTGRLSNSSEEEAVLRKYFEASLLAAYVMRGILSKYDYDCIVLHHGIYTPQGILAEVARSKGVRIVTWHPAYREGCFLFSHGDTYHRTMIKEPSEEWEKMDWDQGKQDSIMKYLRSRWKGTRDWISFQDAQVFDKKEIEQEVGVDFSKPCIGLLTNVVWDAQIHYTANVFSDMLEWLFFTVKYFSQRPELQLLIRVHPAEISGSLPSRQKVVDELKREYPKLPSNIFIIPPNSQISTYAAMDSCDSIIIYGTKTGVELTSTGKQVIVAGEAWIRGKGITKDISSKKEYKEVLDELPMSRDISDAQLARARKYAYHFFFRRMIPIEFISKSEGVSPYKMRINSSKDLAKGADRGLDVICDGILSASPFVFNPTESI